MINDLKLLQKLNYIFNNKNMVIEKHVFTVHLKKTEVLKQRLTLYFFLTQGAT